MKLIPKTFLVPLLLGLSLLVIFSGNRMVAAEWSDDDGGLGEDVDIADLVGMEDDLSGTTTPSLSELAERDRAEQKKQLEEDERAVEQAYFNVGEEDAAAELSPEELDEEEEDQKVVKNDDVEHVDNPEDLEEKEQHPEDSGNGGDPEKPAGHDEDEADSGGEKKYGGQLVVTEEEGVNFDLSSLNRQEEEVSPNISEYAEEKVKFKKDEEEKKKRKEEAKKRRAENNDIHFYEIESSAFREAESKNKNRFSSEVQNAEGDIQAPKKPGLWKRLKHKVDTAIDKLVDRYGSDIKE